MLPNGFPKKYAHPRHADGVGTYFIWVSDFAATSRKIDDLT